MANILQNLELLPTYSDTATMDTTHTVQGQGHGWTSNRQEVQKELTMQNRDAFREKRLGFLLGVKKIFAAAMLKGPSDQSS